MNEDQRLLLDAMSGDRACVRRFVETHWAVVESAVGYSLSVARPRPASRSVKQDLVQDVWNWLLGRNFAPLRSFDPSRGSLKTYLRIRAGDCARALYRQRYRDAPEEIDPSDPWLGDSDTQADATLTRTEARELWQILEKELPPGQLYAFHEMKFLGRTAKEIAATQGISEDAVHQACSRAARRIRSMGQDYQTELRLGRLFTAVLLAFAFLG